MTWFSQVKKDVSLLVAFTKVALKLKYRSSVLGVAWYVLNPLLTFAVLYVIFSHHFSGHIDNYPAYLLIGVVQWHFFQAATSGSLRAVFENGSLIKSVNFRREIVVVAPLLAAVVDHVIELMLLLGIIVYLKLSVSLVFFLPVVIVLQILFALGISFALSSIMVYVSDIQQIWGSVSRLWWVGTPIFYFVQDTSLLYKVNLYVNPEFQLIKVTRDLFIAHALPSISMLLLMCVICSGTFVSGFLIFNHLKHSFPERI